MGSRLWILHHGASAFAIRRCVHITTSRYFPSILVSNFHMYVDFLSYMTDRDYGLILLVIDYIFWIFWIFFLDFNKEIYLGLTRLIVFVMAITFVDNHSLIFCPPPWDSLGLIWSLHWLGCPLVPLPLLALGTTGWVRRCSFFR
jgi:hypothetical protein